MFRLQRRSLDPAHVESKRKLLDAYVKEVAASPAVGSNAALAAFLLRSDEAQAAVDSVPTPSPPQQQRAEQASAKRRTEAHSISSSLESLGMDSADSPRAKGRGLSPPGANGADRGAAGGGAPPRPLHLSPQTTREAHPFLPKVRARASLLASFCPIGI